MVFRVVSLQPQNQNSKTDGSNGKIYCACSAMSLKLFDKQTVFVAMGGKWTKKENADLDVIFALFRHWKCVCAMYFKNMSELHSKIFEKNDNFYKANFKEKPLCKAHLRGLINSPCYLHFSRPESDSKPL